MSTTRSARLDLLSIGGMAQHELVGLSRLKLAFGGEVLAVGDSAPSERPPSGPRGPVICRACTGSRYWVSIHGVTVCGKCHPPASSNLVARWVGDGDGDGAAS